MLQTKAAGTGRASLRERKAPHDGSRKVRGASSGEAQGSGQREAVARAAQGRVGRTVHHITGDESPATDTVGKKHL